MDPTSTSPPGSAADPQQKSSDVADAEFLEKWGCDLEELYRIAVKFFKGTVIYCQ